MAEVQTPVAEPVSATPPTPKRTNEQKKKTKALIKRIVSIVLVLAILAGAGYGVWYFVFREADEVNLGEPIFDMAYTGSINSSVRGYGAANAKSSASIVLTQSGVVDQVFVSQGQMVYEGDPLYVISSEAAQAAYQQKQEAMAKIQEEMDALRKSRSELTITAPHAGQLIEVTDIKAGDPLTEGFKIARVVDNTKLKLSLYYSYAYESDIYVGKEVTVSVPVLMRDLPGKVEKINKVRMVTPEGGVNFEVVIVVDNPGTMTEGMAATASMTDAAGSPIFPYADGEFTYYQTTTIATKAAGPVETLADLMNYADVTAGQTLVVQGTSSVDELIRAKQEQLDAAQTDLEKAGEDLENFSAVSPITGMVVAMSLYEGQEVQAGTTAITIADNSVMTVNIQVDDRNRQYINVGDEIALNDYYGNNYIGVVDSIAVIGENQNGVTVYPAVLRVDNPMGTLMGGYGLNYNFITSQSENCILIPSGDIRYYTPEGAEEPQGVVFVQLQEDREPPAVTIPVEELPVELARLMPKDCVAVPVETGLTNEGQAEIKSGLTDGDKVWNSTPNVDGNYDSWSNGGGFGFGGGVAILG